MVAKQIFRSSADVVEPRVKSSWIRCGALIPNMRDIFMFSGVFIGESFGKTLTVVERVRIYFGSS